jgi:hypothetical protein
MQSAKNNYAWFTPPIDCEPRILRSGGSREGRDVNLALLCNANQSSQKITIVFRELNRSGSGRSSRWFVTKLVLVSNGGETGLERSLR